MPKMQQKVIVIAPRCGSYTFKQALRVAQVLQPKLLLICPLMVILKFAN
jgi:hypothetical protein